MVKARRRPNWRYTIHIRNGKRVKVKVRRKSDGKYLVRKVGVRNYTD